MFQSTVEAYSNLHVCVKKLVLCVKHFGNKKTPQGGQYIVINLHFSQDFHADLSNNM